MLKDKTTGRRPDGAIIHEHAADYIKLFDATTAVNAALGARPRRLPLIPRRVLEAMMENESKAAAAGVRIDKV